MGIQDDKPIPYKTFAAIKSQLVTELQLTPLEWLKLLGPNLDSSGNPQNLLNTSGQVTEASAASIKTDCDYLPYVMSQSAHLQPRFSNFSTPTAVSNGYMRIALVPLSSDGAGAIAATTFVPAIAGYTGHAKLIGIWAHATDAATTWTIAVTGGTLLGPPTHVMAHTANSVTQFGAAAANQTGCPVYVRGTLAADDNKDLTIAAAGYAATETAWLIAEYWYET